MTITLPNPFIDSLSAGLLPSADQLTAHVDHAAVLLSQAKATEGKAGMAGAAGTVRRSTAGTGLRVGEAGAVRPATSEVMDVTAGETATNSNSGDGLGIHEPGSMTWGGDAIATAPSGRADDSAKCPAVTGSISSGPQEAEPFFSIALSEKSASAVIPSAEVTAELEAGIAAIVAGVARKRSHIAFRSFASNSTFIPTT